MIKLPRRKKKEPDVDLIVDRLADNLDEQRALLKEARQLVQELRIRQEVRRAVRRDGGDDEPT